MYDGGRRTAVAPLLLAVLVTAVGAAAGVGGGSQGTSNGRALLRKDDGITTNKPDTSMRTGPEAEPKIAGGSVVPCGRYPFMVSLRDAHNNHKCGGVLVHAFWVMTAAHCVDPNNQASLGTSPIVAVGACNLHDKENEAGPVELLLPEATIIHPSFTGDVMDGGDIALLKLSKPSFHTPISLPPENVSVGSAETLVVLGWGRGLSGEISTELHQGTNMKVIPNRICSGDAVWGNVIGDEMMCAFALSSDGDTCDGDSGGPVLRAFAPDGYVENGRPELDVIYGLTSFGEKGVQCGQSVVPGVYTSVPYYAKWIKDQTESTRPTSPMPANETAAKAPSIPDPTQRPVPDPVQGALQPSAGELPATGATHTWILGRPHGPPAPRTVTAPASVPMPTTEPEPEAVPVPEVEVAKGPNEELPEDPPVEPAPPKSPVAMQEEDAGPEPEDSAEPSKDEAPAAVNSALDGHVIAVAADPEGPRTATILNKLLAKGGDPNACCAAAGRSALHETTLHDNVFAASALLSRGASVDAVDDRGQTPLHLAASRVAPGVAHALLDAGADPDAADGAGETPLHVAAEWSNWKMAQILVEAGADKTALDSAGRTPMEAICATRCGGKQRTKKLQQLLLVL